jgi:hypothetical protein
MMGRRKTGTQRRASAGGVRPGRRAVALTALLFLAGAAARGDIGVTLTMEHTDYIQFEPIIGYLTIVNDTTEPIVIGDTGEGESNTVVQVVVTRGGDTLDPVNDKPFVRRAVIMPSDSHVAMLDVSLWFDMAATDRFFVEAVVTRGDEEGRSKTWMVNVVRGLEVVKVVRGLPGYPGRERTYSLRYWTRERTEILFLSVDEERTGVNYGVFVLGAIVRVQNPRLEVDRNGFVSVTHRTAFNRYARTVFESTPDGVRFIDQSYAQGPSGPKAGPGTNVYDAGDSNVDRP